MTDINTVKSIHIKVRGVVQGVGFRPFIYRLARQYNLNGWVQNTSGSVDIEIEGEETDTDLFLSEISNKAPPLSHIEGLESYSIAKAGYTNFEIRDSQNQAGQYQLVSPDIATCEKCRQEILDPADRRFHYPFTNCTNCGPRFTIINDVPYDRLNTTMSVFQMCPLCHQE